jgi:hypothetical protein
MDQQTSRWIAQLEAEFAEPNGFVWKARYGDFDPEQGERFLRLLSEIKPPKDAPLERRLVSIVWFLPLLMMWQEERISARGGGSFTYNRLVERVTEAVIEILGVP